MRHIIAVLLENEPGALSRVVGLFSARGYNIESLTVAPTEDPSLSRMTVVTAGSDEVIEQITKHLNRLIEVVKVVDLTEGSFTNIFVERGDKLVTPPLKRGLLPGLLRQRLLDEGKAEEADLTPDDLKDGFLIGNMVRGLMKARLA